jgi:transposase
MLGQFSPEFRQRALRMLKELLPEHETEDSAIRHVSTKLGVGPETLRKWRRRAAVDSGARPDVSSEEQAEISRRIVDFNVALTLKTDILRL